MDETRQLSISGFGLERHLDGLWILVAQDVPGGPRRFPVDRTVDDFGLEFNGEAMTLLMNAVRREAPFALKPQFEIRDEVRGRLRQAFISTYLMCKPIEDMGENVWVEVAYIANDGKRKPERVRTAKRFLRRINARDCIRVAERPEFPRSDRVIVETLPSMVSDGPLGAGSLLLVAESDLIYDPN